MKRNKTSALLLAVLILFTTFFNSMPVQAAGEGKVDVTLVGGTNLKFKVVENGKEVLKDQIVVEIDINAKLSVLKAVAQLKADKLSLTEGYEIKGYRIEGTDVDLKDDYKFTADTKINIRVDKKEYTVKFDSKYLKQADEKVLHGNKIKAKDMKQQIVDGTKHDFIGWYKEAGYTNIFKIDTDTVTSDMTLYAKWEDAGKVQYDVTFTNVHGETKTMKVDHGGKANRPASPKEDEVIVKDDGMQYKFLGWYKGDALYNFDTEVKEAITLNAKWEDKGLKEYTVTFKDRSGNSRTETVSHNSKVNKPTSPKIGEELIENGMKYKFEGWTKDDAPYNFDEKVIADFTLKEKWSEAGKVQHKVTFEDAYNTHEPKTVNDGEKVTAPSSPKVGDKKTVGSKEYEFKYWTLNGSEYNFNTPVKSNLTLTAKWEEVVKEKVTITFKAGVGGKLDGNAEVKVDKGSTWSSVTVPKAVAAADYEFKGWSPALPSDSSVVNYDASYEAKFEKKVVPVDKVTVKFTSGDNGYISGTKEHTLNKGTSSRGYIPTPIANSGYVFDRWSPSVPNYFNYSETYTAIFKKAPAERLTIKFVAGANGYLEGKKEFSVDKGYWSSDITKPIPKPDAGYVFDYWGPSIPSRFNESRTYTAYFKRASSSTVTVKYLDRYGRRVAGTETYTGRVGEEYRTYAKDANGFKLRDNSLPGNRTGKFTDKNITVEYQYTENYIPSGKVRVTFLDSRNGELKNRKGELVDIVLETVDRNTKWKNIWLPPVTAESGYRHDRWSPALPSGETKIDSNKEFTAYFERTNANKIVVRFQAGSNGYIEGNTKYEVTKGSKWTDISVPRPVANSGYYFNKWNPDFPKTIEKDVTYTAEFLPVTESYDEKHKAYIEGYPDGTFRPEANVTRAEAATMFTRVLIEDARGYSNNFLDVKNNDWHNIYVSYLSAKGFIDGYPDGTFRPDVPMTRAEFAAIASRIKKLSGGVSTFKDVSPQHWAKEYIQALADGGIVKGYGNNEFRPDVYITREEAVTMINRLLERKMDRDFINRHNVQYTKYKDISRERWSFADIQEASISHDAKMNKYDGERWNKIIN